MDLLCCAKKSAKSLFGSAVIAGQLLLFGVFCAVYFFSVGLSEFSYPLGLFTAVEALLLPASLWYILKISHPSAPQREQLAAAAELFLAPVLVFVLYPLLFAVLGGVNIGAAYASLLGYLLLLFAFFAVEYFVLCVCRHKICSLILAYAVSGCLFFFHILPDLLKALLPTAAQVLVFFDLFARFSSFSGGYFDLSAAALYLSVGASFLFFAVIFQKAGEGKFLKLFRKKTAVCIVLAISLLCNCFAALLPEHVRRIDLSFRDTFQVSDVTEQNLQTLDTSVTVYFLCAGGKNTEDSDLYLFLLKYASLSKNITIKIADPEKDTMLLENAGIGEFSDRSFLVVSDLRSRLVDNSELYYYHNQKLGVSLSPGEYTACLSAYAAGDRSDAAAYTSGYLLYQYASYTTAYFCGESKLTNAILFAAAPKVPTVCWVGSTTPDSGFVSTLEQQNYHLVEWNMRDPLPNICDLLFFNVPTVDLTDDAKAAVAQYLSGGGKMLLLTDYRHLDLPNLFALSAEYGLSPGEEAVICESDPNYYVTVSDTSAQNWVYAHIGGGDLTGTFDGNFIAANAHPILIVSCEGVTQSSWLYTGESGCLRVGDAIGDARASYTFGAVAKKGESTLLWISTPFAVDSTVNGYAEGGNYALLLNAFEAVISHRGNTITLLAREVPISTLQLDAVQKTLWGILLAGVLPVAVLTCGLVGFLREKKKGTLAAVTQTK